jgi:hypothetical protein
VGAVKFEFTTRDSDVEKSYRKLERENTKLRSDLDKVKRASHDANAAGQKGMAGNIDLAGRLTKSIGAITASWFTATQAIAIYNAERRRQIELDNQAKSTQLTVAQAEAQLIKNFGDAPKSEIDSFIKSLEKVNQDTKFGNLAALLESSASTLSATGGNRQLTLGLLTEAASIFRDDPTQLPAFASALGDVAKINKAQSSDDFKRAMGMVLSTQGVARIENLKSFENVAPALASIANLDTTGNPMTATKEGAALFAALGGAIGDKQGAITKTGSISLASQLADFLPESDIIGAGGSVLQKGTGFKSLDQRITAIQNDVELQRQFFYGSESFKGATFPLEIAEAAKALLTNPDSSVARAYRDNQSLIKPDVGLVDRLKTNLQTAGRQGLATAQAELDTKLEQFKLEDTEGSRRAFAREAYTGLAQRAVPGLGGFLRRGASQLWFEAQMEFGVDPAQAARSAYDSLNLDNQAGDLDRFESIKNTLNDTLKRIEQNTRNQGAIPDQMNSQKERQ